MNSSARRLVLVMVSLVSFAVAWSQERKVSLPMVSSAALPLYPPLARYANIEGIVHVRLTTDGHHVIAVQAQDGPKALAVASEENAKTWQFAPHDPTTFIVTYTYSLVTDWKGDPNNPEICFRLPTVVEISTRRWSGTVDMPFKVK